MNRSISVGKQSLPILGAMSLLACTGQARAESEPIASPESSGGSSIVENTDTTLSLKPRGWGPPVRIIGLWENDSSVAKLFDTSDRYYTNGLRFDIAWRPSWMVGVAKALPFGEPMGETPAVAFGLSATHKIFTPRDKGTKDPLPDDRPYAGWLSFSGYIQRSGEINEHLAIADHMELDMGIVGSWTGAEQLQNGAHRIFGFDRVEGWDNQLANEFTIDLTLRRKWRFTTGPDEQGLELQFIPEVGGTLGTVYRQLESYATVRWGMNLPDDFGPSRINDINIATGGWLDDFGFYLFARAGGRAVEHNLFLDGNTFANSLSVTKEPLVGEVQAGIVVLLWSHLEIGYSQTYSTQQFTTQEGDPAFGAWTIAWRTEF